MWPDMNLRPPADAWSAAGPGRCERRRPWRSLAWWLCLLMAMGIGSLQTRADGPGASDPSAPGGAAGSEPVGSVSVMADGATAAIGGSTAGRAMAVGGGGALWVAMDDEGGESFRLLAGLEGREGKMELWSAARLRGRLTEPGLAAWDGRLWLVYEDRTVQSLRLRSGALVGPGAGGGAGGGGGPGAVDPGPGWIGLGGAGAGAVLVESRAERRLPAGVVVRSLAADERGLWALVRVETRAGLEEVDALDPASSAGAAVGVERLLRLTAGGWRKVELPVDWAPGRRGSLAAWSGTDGRASSDRLWLVSDEGGGRVKVYRWSAASPGNGETRAGAASTASTANPATTTTTATITTTPTTATGPGSSTSTATTAPPTGDRSGRTDGEDAEGSTDEAGWASRSSDTAANDASANDTAAAARPRGLGVAAGSWTAQSYEAVGEVDQTVTVGGQLVAGVRALIRRDDPELAGRLGATVRLRAVVLRPEGAAELGVLSLPSAGGRPALVSLGGTVGLTARDAEGVWRWSRIGLDGRTLAESATMTQRRVTPLSRTADYILLLIVLVVATLVLLVFWKRDGGRAVVRLPGHQAPAELGARASAGLIDLLPSVLLTMGWFGLSPAELLRQWPGRSVTWEAMLPGAVCIATLLIHTTLGELFFARSLGKALLGLRVSGLAGQPPNLWQVLARNLLRVPELVALPLLLLPAFSPHRQRLGDMLGRTLVVGPAPPKRPEPPEDEA